MDAWLDLKVKSKEQLTANVVKLELVGFNGEELPEFEAGSNIDVQIPGGILRPYSLCNSPLDHSRFVIAVRRETHSRGASLFLHDRVRIGDAIRVRHPLNAFPLDGAAPYSALFGGGVGIAPLLSMAEKLWNVGAAFELHLSARNARNAPFWNYLNQASFRNRVHSHWSESGTGRIDFASQFQRLSPLSKVYLCGPIGFIDAAIGAASACGVSPERLRLERF